MSNILTNNINPRSGNVINIGGVNDKVSIAGTLTYEDVTSVDSIGIITARSDVHVGAGLSVVGVTTAQSGVEFGTVGSGVTISAVGADTSLGFLVNGSERVRIDSSGRFGIGTNGPASKLHVANSSSAEIELILDPGDSSSEVAYINSYRTNAPLGFKAGDTERMRIDADGRLLVGTSSTPPANTADVFIKGGTGSGGAGGLTITRTNSTPADNNSLGNIYFSDSNGTPAGWIHSQRDGGTWTSGSSQPSRLVFATTADGASSPTERIRITSDGILTNKTAGIGSVSSFQGFSLGPRSDGYAIFSRDAANPVFINRFTDDGGLVGFYQNGTAEGDISVSGSTVSYNGAHLSRWSQLAGGAERIEILRGSVLSNLDEMCEWTYEAKEAIYYTEEDELPEGVSVGDIKELGREAGTENNEQLNRMKISDVEGDPNVAGIFQGWDNEDETYTNDFYCAMTGDFIIRIAEGVTVQRGDLLMSAGDGTAKPQDDDIIRSKTIAKVTSTHVTCTYDDGSYCVPCVLMAC